MKKITGKEISYLYICQRKLWLFHHGLRPELEHVNVQIGMHIQESTFTRHEKDIPIGNIGVIDWAEFDKGIIHETKKGRTPNKGDEAQVRYYMWWCNNHDINVVEARIHYPKLRKTNSLFWTEEMNAAVAADLKKCANIIEQSQPPDVQNYKYCKSCAYWEMCYA